MCLVGCVKTFWVIISLSKVNCFHIIPYWCPMNESHELNSEWIMVCRYETTLNITVELSLKQWTMQWNWTKFYN